MTELENRIIPTCGTTVDYKASYSEDLDDKETITIEEIESLFDSN